MPGRPEDRTPISAVMGPGTRYEGDLVFEGRVRVDGAFNGRIYTEETLEVGAEGVVEGEFDVASALVAGRVKGTLRVRERLVLEPGSHFEGKLDAGVVEVRPGARMNGEVRIRGEELP